MRSAGRVVVASTREEWSDELEDYERVSTEVPDQLLFHWSPADRRKQIIRYGLRPSMRGSLTALEWRAPYVCFADSPAWAWALSGEMGWAPDGQWDCWQTWMSDLGAGIDIIPDPTRQSGIYEVRTPNRVFKRDLWLVGSRIKAA